jgi:two-component system cell cycle sensor histidine kinase/response regulator CckA
MMYVGCNVEWGRGGVNWYIIPVFAGFLLNGFVWTYAFAHRKHDPINRSYLAFAAAVTLWVFLELVMALPIESDIAFVLMKLKMFCWLPVGFLFLRSVFTFTGRPRNLLYWTSLAAVLIAGCVSFMTDLVEKDVEWAWWGWREVDGPLFLPVVAATIVFPVVYSIMCVYSTIRNPGTHDHDKGQLRFIVRGGIITVILGLTTDVVLPNVLGIVDVIPDGAALLTSILSVHLHMAVMKRDAASIGLDQMARMLFENSLDGVVAVDDRGTVLAINEVAAELLGVRGARAEGKPLSTLVPGYEPTADGSRRETYIEGTESLVSWTSAPIHRDGFELGSILVMRNVTERHEAEAALRQSEERFRHMAESVWDGLTIVEDGDVVYVSDRACEIFGYPRDELKKLSWLDLAAEEEQERVRKLLSETQVAGTGEMEFWVVRKDGTMRYVCNRYSQSRRDDGVLWRFVVSSDVTDRKRVEAEKFEIEEQLRYSQKMEAIGNLAGGVAHDFNNLLTGILGYSNLIKMSADPGTELLENISVIEMAAQRAAELTGQLLGFARRGKLRNAPVDLHRIIGEVVSILTRTVDKDISMAQRLAAFPPIVIGDMGQLQQVIMNLAVNARDAMPKGGDLVFETSVEEVDAERVRSRQGIEPGKYIRLCVSDTGEGIPEELRGRVFEPFFTTKPPGQGTGMGLAMVYGIVTNHGGCITLSSEVGRGTTFEVLLPLAKGASRPKDTPTNLTPVRGSGTILVVDDEVSVRKVVASMLEPLGYAIVSVNDGKQAVEYYEEHGPDIDLVLLDLMMPVMNGKDCFRRLKAIDPEVRVLLSTGHTLDGEAQELLDQGSLRVIQKPFAAAELSEAVAKALKPKTRRLRPRA